jgi:hypothetical protein
MKIQNVEKLLQLHALTSRGSEFSPRFNERAVGRKFFISSRGYMGWLPSAAQENDIVCVFYGCRIPFAIRIAGQNRYQLLGDCYMHGLMDGEAINIDVDSQMISII